MKKGVLILGALAFGAFVFKDKLFGQTAATDALPIADASGQITAENIFSFNNRVFYDASGIWFLVRDGKLYTPAGQASLDAFVAANPGATFDQLPFDVWKYWAAKDNTKFGGSF